MLTPVRRLLKFKKEINNIMADIASLEQAAARVEAEKWPEAH